MGGGEDATRKVGHLAGGGAKHLVGGEVVGPVVATLLLAPLLMVQILRTGGPDFQELLRVILTADITSGTLFSFSGTHFWLQYSSGTQFAQNYFGHDAQDLRI